MELDEANRIRDEVKARIERRNHLLLASIHRFAEEYADAKHRESEAEMKSAADSMLRVVGKEFCWAWMDALDFPGVFPRFDDDGSP